MDTASHPCHPDIYKTAFSIHLYLYICTCLGTRTFFSAGYPAILEYRVMNGLMFWPRLPWIRQNSFIIELRPMCCNTRLTVRDVFLSCAKYAHIRRKYFAFNSLFELFRDTPAGFIIQFLRECNLYSVF